MRSIINTIRNISKCKRGLSLGNVIVGITIFIIAITSIFALSISSFRAAQSSADRVEAIFLAREAVEIVRNIRDYSRYNLASFLDSSDFQSATTYNMSNGGVYIIGANTMINTGSTYIPDTTQWKVVHIADRVEDIGTIDTGLYTASDNRLTISSAGGIIASRYSRYVVLDFLDTQLQTSATPTNIMRITAYIKWTKSGNEHTYKLTDILTNT